MAVPSKLKHIPKLHLIILISLSLILLILATIWTEQRYSETLSEEFALPIPTTTTTKSQPEKKKVMWASDTVKPGDNLSNLFARNGLNAKDSYFISQAAPKEAILFKPGQRLRWQTNSSGDVTLLHIEVSATKTHILKREQSKDSFIYQLEQKTADSLPRFASAKIENSLFLDGGRAGVPQQILIALADIFAWDIDFGQDIRKGDSFSLIYEERFLDGKRISNGDILVARFTNRGKSYTAIRYKTPDGKISYYNEKGLSMRKAFLRNPVDFVHITSRFNLKRMHPVLHIVRPHRGTDYAAPIGTPIKSTGDGKVIFTGRKGGYGKTIIIQHGSHYQTLYGHLNRFNKRAKRGRTVKQGQIIGYVGSTGISTGPHVHYEFRIDGVHKDSLKIKLPAAKPIAKKHKAAFLKTASQKINWLESYQAGLWE